MNIRIFTWTTLRPTKVKNHDLPPIGFSTLHYHGQIDYKVTHPVTSNSHTNVQHLWTLTHVLVSPILGHNTHSLKEWNFLLTTILLSKANCKDNQSSNIFAKTWIISITLTKYKVFSFESSQILQNRKPISLNFMLVKNKVFSSLNNFEQTEFKQEKETSKK